MEVGQLVRTKNKGICKIEGFASTLTDDYIENEKGSLIPKDEITKVSHNIIDLIEVGDYVNGYKIYSIYNDDSVVNEYNLKHKKCLGKNIYDEDYQEYLIYEEEIETTVTKEQFEAIQYKVV